MVAGMGLHVDMTAHLSR